MFSKERDSFSECAPLALHTFSEDDHSSSSLVDSDNLPALAPSKSSQLPKLILYFSIALALLSAANIALFPVTLSKYRAYPLSDLELETLPYGDARLGLDRAAKMIPTPQVYHQAWPDKIARVSRKLKKAVWGQGVQVYTTVEVRMSVLPSPCSRPSISHPPISPGQPACVQLLTQEKGLNNHALPHPLHWRQRLRALLAAASRVLCACKGRHDQGGYNRNRSLAAYRALRHLHRRPFQHGRARF